MPKGLTSIWERNTTVYLTTIQAFGADGAASSVSSSSAPVALPNANANTNANAAPAALTPPFAFRINEAKLLPYTQKFLKDSQNWLCVDFDAPLPLGHHVLTVVPTTSDTVAIAYLMLP